MESKIYEAAIAQICPVSCAGASSTPLPGRAHPRWERSGEPPPGQVCAYEGHLPVATLSGALTTISTIQAFRSFPAEYGAERRTTGPDDSYPPDLRHVGCRRD